MDNEIREKVIKGMIEHINEFYSASTGWGITTIGNEGVSTAEIAKVHAALIKDGKYIGIRRDDGNYDMLLNPNYELNESIKATNASAQILNASLKKSNKRMLIIAAITGFFIAGQFLLLPILSPKDPYMQLEKIRQYKTMFSEVFLRLILPSRKQ